MTDSKIFIGRLKRQCNTYPFCSAEVGKFYCVKIHKGLSPQGIDCWVINLIGREVPPAYVSSLDWVRYYFDFK
jgi:hypothetical protein